MTTTKNPAAVALGRLGGAAKTPAQQEAARANGKRGGRPRKAKPASITNCEENNNVPSACTHYRKV